MARADLAVEGAAGLGHLLARQLLWPVGCTRCRGLFPGGVPKQVIAAQVSRLLTRQAA
jgi:hypothetical protein